MRSLVIRLAFVGAVVTMMVVGTLINIPTSMDPKTLWMLTLALYVADGMSVLVGLPTSLRQARPAVRLVMMMAFFESGAVYGLLLTLLGAPIVHLYVFGGIALALIIGSFVLAPME